MINMTLKDLKSKASEMAIQNIWGENAYKINMTILKYDKNNCAAYTRLAKYFKLKNNIAEAKNMYLKTLNIDPKNQIAINNLEDIEQDQRENDTVNKMKTTKELLKEGKSSMTKGRYRLAVKIFSKVYNSEPLLTHAVSLAGAYKKMGKFDNIEKLYLQLIENNNKKADIKAIEDEFKLLRINGSSVTE